jgi:hypothetical protein
MISRAATVGTLNQSSKSATAMMLSSLNALLSFLRRTPAEIMCDRTTPNASKRACAAKHRRKMPKTTHVGG